ncbi:hypothetical protein CLV96_3945 [Leptospira meyeri]|uniref:Uncharacterized protein n=1 Tax=Leptospira meyeri TaxID=29508 RepID=A0A4R8MIZ0_LEPME|nr:hypothetical protein [Leptospira meyeri]EKJ86120.1 hypothetical protein LEP1GSC017_4003 [Leptospira meyeri serovar Hardjo str. Went 5]TDY66375.1 hypothetical protein CLV96_3945 [Leptospira meyeri]
MGDTKKNKFRERNNSSYERKLKNVDLKEGKKKEPYIVFSLKDYDSTQGQTFQDWEQSEILALTLKKLQEISRLSVIEAQTKGIIKPYPKVPFPPSDKTEFYHPAHVLPGVTWCSLHVQGKECVIGYFEDHIFNIVFLDKNHLFWISEKKNT